MGQTISTQHLFGYTDAGEKDESLLAQEKSNYQLSSLDQLLGLSSALDMKVLPYLLKGIFLQSGEREKAQTLQGDQLATFMAALDTVSHI